MKNATRCLTLLSGLLFGDSAKEPGKSGSHAATQNFNDALLGFVRPDFGELWGLASSHHVIMRTFPELRRLIEDEGSDKAEWVDHAVVKEQARIDHALSFLSPICDALGRVGDVVVIKSLDHWPDLGSDLDLYSNAESADIVAIMRERFKAQAAERSWGDRLANKWNFIVPGLPELVEVHVGRLGQTGEQVAIYEFNIGLALLAMHGFGAHTLRVPAAEGRLIISTLQRMYRHFYLRLCDIADTARLLSSRSVDYTYLQKLARSAGLWDGLATYLALTVSGYVQSYGGEKSFLYQPCIGYGVQPLATRRSNFDGSSFCTPDLPARREFLYLGMEETLVKW